MTTSKAPKFAGTGCCVLEAGMAPKDRRQSALTGQITEISRMHVSNAGGTDKVCDYDVQTPRGGNSEAFEARVVHRRGKVTTHHRLKLHVWHLVARALQAMGYGRL
jgi:hypothetical protein